MRTWHLLTRRWSGWLLAALVLATLAPGVSRALSSGMAGHVQAQPGQHWVALCTSQGMQWVAMDLGARTPADAPDPDAPASTALDRCGHCTLAAERFAPLIPDLPVVPVLAGRWVVPVLAATPCVDALLRAAQARGPPLLG
ncbi:MAG: DUF2946 family protein [Hydrogenophaga sp.]